MHSSSEYKYRHRSCLVIYSLLIGDNDYAVYSLLASFKITTGLATQRMNDPRPGAAKLIPNPGHYRARPYRPYVCAQAASAQPAPSHLGWAPAADFSLYNHSRRTERFRPGDSGAPCTLREGKRTEDHLLTDLFQLEIPGR